MLSSSSSLLFNALQTSTRKLQQQQQKDAQVCRKHTTTYRGWHVFVWFCVCLYTFVYRVCASRNCSTYYTKIYIQYTFCSLTCSCSWRFYSLYSIHSFSTHIYKTLFSLFRAFSSCSPHSHLSNTNFLLNGFISYVRDWNSIKSASITTFKRNANRKKPTSALYISYGEKFVFYNAHRFHIILFFFLPFMGFFPVVTVFSITIIVFRCNFILSARLLHVNYSNANRSHSLYFSIYPHTYLLNELTN